MMGVTHGFLQIKSQTHWIPLGWGAPLRVEEIYRQAKSDGRATFEIHDSDGVKHTIATDEFVRVIHDA